MEKEDLIHNEVPLPEIFYLFPCLNNPNLLYKRKCYKLSTEKCCVLWAHVYVPTHTHTQFSHSREMLSPLTLVPLLRICPKEIMQNVGGRKSYVHKTSFLLSYLDW